MTCWRVEDDNEEGPYRNADLDGMGYEHTISDRHPAPPPDSKDSACAIDNPAGLLEWFAGYWPILFDKGFHIVEVMTDGTRTTDFGQVIFEGPQQRRRVDMCELLHNLLADGAYR